MTIEHPSDLDDKSDQDAAHFIPRLTLDFTEVDVAEMARRAGITIKNPDFIGPAGSMLRGIAEAFAEMARLQREEPGKRTKGRPKDYARQSMLFAFSHVYWRLTGERPNFRNSISQRDGESKTSLFLKSFLVRSAEQLESATDPESNTRAREFRHLLALKNLGMTGGTDKALGQNMEIAKTLYPQALEGAGPPRGRPYGRGSGRRRRPPAGASGFSGK